MRRWRIPRFLKFGASSLSATALDLVLFQGLQGLLVLVGLVLADAIVVATVLARCASASLSFTLNRQAVFHDKGRFSREALRFALLAVLIAAASALLVSTIADGTGLPSLLVKLPVDGCLFFVNYTVQRRWVFVEPAAGSGELPDPS